MSHLARGPEQVGDPVGRTLEHGARQKGELRVGTRKWVSRAKGETQRPGTETGRDPGPRGQAVYVSLRSLLQGELRCPAEPATTAATGVWCPCKVSGVCTRGRVSGGPEHRGLVIYILSLQWEENRSLSEKLCGPGSVQAHAVSVYTGLGLVQPAEATCESLGQDASNSTRKSARVRSHMAVCSPSRRLSRPRVLKPVSAHTELH